MRFTSNIVLSTTLLVSFQALIAQTPVTCHIRTFNTVTPAQPFEGLASSVNRYGNIVGTDAKGRAYVRFTNGAIHLIPMPITGIILENVGKRNASGVTVGSVESVNSARVAEQHGFINSGSTTRFIDTQLIGINRFGTMLAQFPLNAAIEVIRGGARQLIPIPFEFQRDIQMSAISDTGVIVGSYALQNSPPDPDQTMHGFVLAKGQFVDLAHPDTLANTFITDINATGEIVGVLDSGSADSFIFKNGKFFNPKFILPNGTVAPRHVFIEGVNGFGTITGVFSTPSKTQPFVGSCAL